MASKNVGFFRRIISSNWFITLFSTMFGVIFGLYLNSRYEARTLHREKQKALTQVQDEITDNQETLADYYEVLHQKNEALGYVFSKLTADGEIIIATDSLDHFLARTAGTFELEGSEAIDDDQLRLRGELSLNLNSKLLVNDLSHVMWDSYKQTDYLSITPFKCLTDIQGIYELQEEVNDLNFHWRSAFMKGDFILQKEKREAFMTDWGNLLLKQELLLKLYQLKEDALEACS